MWLHIILCICVYFVCPLDCLMYVIFITTQLQAEKKQLMSKLKEIDQQEDKLRVSMFSTIISHISMYTYVIIMYIIVNPRGSSPHYLIQYHVQVTGCDLCLAMTFIRYFCNLLWTIHEIPYIVLGKIHRSIVCVKKCKYFYLHA